MKSFFSVHGPIHLDCFRKADVIKVEVDTCGESEDGNQINNQESDFSQQRRHWLIHDQRAA